MATQKAEVRSGVDLLVGVLSKPVKMPEGFVVVECSTIPTMTTRRTLPEPIKPRNRDERKAAKRVKVPVVVVGDNVCTTEVNKRTLEQIGAKLNEDIENLLDCEDICIEPTRFADLRFERPQVVEPLTPIKDDVTTKMYEYLAAIEKIIAEELELPDNYFHLEVIKHPKFH